MARWTDAQRRAWHVVIDVPGIERIRQVCGFDLVAPGAVLLIEAADPVLIGQMLEILLAEEISRRGCPLREFQKGLRQEALAGAAAALVAALVEFYPEADDSDPAAGDEDPAEPVDLLELCYRLAGAVGIWPGPGCTARKLVWMHRGRTRNGELTAVLTQMFAEQKPLSTTDPRILFP